MAFQLSQNFIGIFLEPRIPKIYQFRPLPMALGIVSIRIGIKMEFVLNSSYKNLISGKMYDRQNKIMWIRGV